MIDEFGEELRIGGELLYFCPITGVSRLGIQEEREGEGEPLHGYQDTLRHAGAFLLDERLIDERRKLVPEIGRIRH